MSTNTKLNKYKGRLFVVLCGCNSDWHDDMVKFNEQLLCYERADVPAFYTSVYEDKRGMMIPKCKKCNFDPWIILPKGEKYDKEADK